MVDGERGSQLAEHRRSRPVRSAVGAVHDDPESVQGHPGHAFGGESFVAFGRIGNVFHRPDIPLHGSLPVDFSTQDQFLETLLYGVIELVAVAAEELDTIVGRRVVGCGNDDSPVGPQLPDKAGHGRSRHDAGKQDIGPHRVQPRNHRGLEHRAGSPGVASDHEPGPLAAMLSQKESERTTESKRGFRRDRMHVGHAPDPVGAEELPLMHGLLPFLRFLGLGFPRLLGRSRGLRIRGGPVVALRSRTQVLMNEIPERPRQKEAD